MTNPTKTGTTYLWPCLTFADARGTVAFLVETFGFQETSHYARENDPSIVEHGELRWPLGGGIMYSSIGRDDSPFCNRPAGIDNVYVVCDNPDELFDRATAANAEIVRGLRDESYGSRGFTIRDPEGNLWSFGTYRGE
ncbi:VOC family protein [Nocardia sp. NPDC048505]|uniref:VOC family protein n=1 Tax=unclassified Nocardia TaxID=2637762 RepID=UPI0033EE77E1